MVLVTKTPSDNAPSAIGRRRAAAKDVGRAAYAKRRAEIMAAAGEVFKREGFHGASIGRIAEALDMDRATLYYYMGSKQELFDAAVSDAVRANVATAESIRDGAGTAPEKLRALMISLMESYAAHYPFLYVFIQENLTHVAKDEAEWAEEMRALNRRYEDVVIEVLEAGIAEGSLRPAAEPWLIGYGVIGMVAWTNRWFNPRKSEQDATAIGSAFADILLRGLSSEEEPIF